MGGVTSHLRKLQAEETRGVTRDRDIGLIPLLAVLIRWPDFDFGRHLVQGFPAVGHCSWSGVWESREVPPEDRHDFFEGSEEHNRLTLSRLRLGLHDETIFEKSTADAEKNFATQPMRLPELLKYLRKPGSRNTQFRFIKRFIITQASG